MIERTKATLVIAAGAILAGLVAIWWYVRRRKSS